VIEGHDVDNTNHTILSTNMDNLYKGVIANKPSVLLIDDDEEMRTYMRQILTDTYTILEADSAETGRELLGNVEPDLIISDIVMKGISGVEFCSELKNAKETSYIPLILLTGSSSPEVKLKGIECGADDFITKPFGKELLLARIKSLLRGRDSLKTYFINEVTLQNNNEKIAEEYSLFLKRCIEIVEKHLQEEHFNVKEFVREMGMSHSNVFRKVKSISGLSISEFIRYLRLKKAAELMIQTDIQVKEVAFRVGLQDLRYFREQFHKLFGLNPSDYIKKYRRAFFRPSRN
jgi:DNA-binding response OmpR family regulator